MSTFQAVTTGHIAHWDVSTCLAQPLFDGLDPLGLGAFAPKPRTKDAALSMALNELGKELEKSAAKGNGAKHRYVVESKLNRSADGFELVDNKIQKVEDNDHRSLITTKVSESYRVEISQFDYSLPVSEWEALDALQDKFDRMVKETTGVGRSLVSIIHHVQGTCLRQVGGLYFFPDGVGADFLQARQVFEDCGGAVIEVMEVKVDADAARGIRKAIVKELAAEAGEMLEDLVRNDIRDATVERRLVRCKELRSKCTLYEGILSDTLGEVRLLLDQAEKCQSTSQAIQDDDTVFESNDVFA